MEESVTDANPRFPVSNQSQVTLAINKDAINDESKKVERPQPKFNPDDLFYDMSGDKFLIIFNHTFYKSTQYFNFQTPSPRKGTDMDVMALRKSFSVLGYKILTYHDLKHGEIIEKATEISRMDHTKTSCLCFAILTHGDKGGQLFAADRPYLFSDVTKILENGDTSLVNKPKLFFIQIGIAPVHKVPELSSRRESQFELAGNKSNSVIFSVIVQACRGAEMDSGRTVQIDGDDDVDFHVPSHADFFVMYSTVEGYVAYRDVNGSFMIQELCRVMDKFHDSLDVLHIATLLNRRVAYERISYSPRNIETHNKKQMPEARFTLTKLFKF